VVAGEAIKTISEGLPQLNIVTTLTWEKQNKRERETEKGWVSGERGVGEVRVR
jgi:hypothetical protein